MKILFFYLFLILPLIGMTQIMDDFTDGNFTINPSWSGDTNHFEINTNKQLHLSASGADTAKLTTQNSMISNTEWDFWVKLSFNTSANNFARIYLVADNSDLAGSVTGYFLQIGGSNDSIEFIRQNGTVYQTLFVAKNSFTGSTVNMIRIKVIHDAAGKWYLLADNTGNSNFTEEGSSADNSITHTSIFGVFCKFTSSNSTKFYFDDFYVGRVIIDSVAPSISTVSVDSENKLSIKFSEEIDATEGEKTTNYFIPGHGSPLTASRDSTDFGRVCLKFENSFTDGSCDTIQISNIKDIHGNKAAALQHSFCFYSPRSFDIVIDEIMADPTPQTGLPDAEYIELYNRTQFPISLKDWIFESGTTRKILPDVTINPLNFLILTKGTLLSYFAPTVDLFTSSSTLTNDGTTLVLKNSENQVIHSVCYSPEWYKNSLKQNGGWSLEMIDPANPCGCAENWSASESLLGGTPGTINSINRLNPDTIKPRLKRALIENDSLIRVKFSESIDSSSFMEPVQWIVDNETIRVIELTRIPPTYDALTLHLSSPVESGVVYTLWFPGGLKDCSGNLLQTDKSVQFAKPDSISNQEIIINEILPDPFPGGERFIELFNRSLKIFDLQQTVLLDSDSSLSEGKGPVSLSEESYLFFPGQYTVLTKDPSDILSRYRAPDADCFIKMTTIPGMTDENGTIILARKNDLEFIDKVTYSKEMNFALLTSPDGVSLERITPAGSSDDKNNWHSAAGSCGYATPGYINSQNMKAGITDNVVDLYPEIFSPDNDGKDDILFIRFRPDRPGYLANVSIYASNGRLVRRLIRNELVPTDGVFPWDGTTEENMKAPAGIYIVRIELFTSDGVVKHFIKTTVLGSRL
jgi:hypothetical protein